MNAHALLHGKRKPKVIEIGLKADDLWWLAWGLAGKSLTHAPIKIGKAHQQELRADGIEIAAFLLGGPFGIVAAMRFFRFVRERKVTS